MSNQPERENLIAQIHMILGELGATWEDPDTIFGYLADFIISDKEQALRGYRKILLQVIKSGERFEGDEITLNMDYFVKITEKVIDECFSQALGELPTN